MKALLFSLFFASSLFRLSHAGETCGSNAPLEIPLQSDFKRLVVNASKLSYWTSSDEQVENAVCGNPGAVTEAEIEEHFSSKAYEIVEDDVFGLKLKDSSRKIKLLRKLLAVKEYSVTGAMEQPSYNEINCKKVNCVLDKVFGARIGMKAIYALDKFGINLSHTRARDLSPWSEKEVDNILETLDDLPPSLFPLKEDQMLAHYDRSKDMGDTYGTASILFFKLFDEESPQLQRQLIYHEIGHTFGAHVGPYHDHAGHLDEDKDWSDISKWRKNKGGGWDMGDLDSFPSMYSGENPKEDFAESFTAYRYNPAFLKEVSPEKYEYMKKYVYLGKEYLSEETCIKEPAIFKKIGRTKVSAIESYDACGPQLLNTLFMRQEVEELRGCVKEELARKSVEELPLEDEKLKKSILKYGMNKVASLQGPISDEELKLYTRKFLNKLRKEFAKEYYSLNGCEIPSKYGNTFFKSFSSVKLDKKNALSSFALKVCTSAKQAKTIDENDPKLIETFDSLLEVF